MFAGNIALSCMYNTAMKKATNLFTQIKQQNVKFCKIVNTSKTNDLPNE